jgi:hypothetical protein
MHVAGQCRLPGRVILDWSGWYRFSVDFRSCPKTRRESKGLVPVPNDRDVPLTDSCDAAKIGYSITWSARSRKDGIVVPIASAVFTFTDSLNLLC